MSAFILLFEQAQIVLPQWIGWSGVGAISLVGIAVNNGIKGKLEKKVDKEVFDEYRNTEEAKHSAMNEKVDRIDENVQKLVDRELDKIK